MIAGAKVVFLKELTDSLRDRKQLATALFYVLLGPLMLVPLIGYIGKLANQGTTNHLQVAATGAERAPALVEYLRQRNIELTPGPADPTEAVKSFAIDLVLVIPESYPEDFAAGGLAKVRVVTDTTRNSAHADAARVEGAIASYSDTVGSLRLRARGTNPNIVSAVAIEVDDVAPPEGAGGAHLLSMIPVFLMMALFFGGVSIAVDVTAGERERASLEPLMSTPVSATAIVLGKLSAVMLFSLAAAFASLAAFTLVVNFAPLPEIPGLKFKLELLGALEIAVAVVPLVLPVAALEMIVASRGRTTKESYTATSIFAALIPGAPTMFLMFAPAKATLTLMAIPIIGQTELLNLVLRGETLRPLDFVVAAVSATFVGVALTVLAVLHGSHARLLSAH